MGVIISKIDLHLRSHLLLFCFFFVFMKHHTHGGCSFCSFLIFYFPLLVFWVFQIVLRDCRLRTFESCLLWCCDTWNLNHMISFSWSWFLVKDDPPVKHTRSLNHHGIPDIADSGKPAKSTTTSRSWWFEDWRKIIKGVMISAKIFPPQRPFENDDFQFPKGGHMDSFPATWLHAKVISLEIILRACLLDGKRGTTGLVVAWGSMAFRWPEGPKSR